MAFFPSLRASARPVVVDLVTGRFSGTADAIRATSTLEGAQKAMVQFGFEPPVALAALTRSTHLVRDLPASVGRDSGFWVKAFEANPLLAMPETQPAFVRKLLVGKPTTRAQEAVAPQVASLRASLGRASDLKPTDFQDVATLRAALRSREPVLTRWLSFFG